MTVALIRHAETLGRWTALLNGFDCVSDAGDLQRVYVVADSAKGETLRSFAHPAECAYVFGRDDVEAPEDPPVGAVAVNIGLAACRSDLWADQAAAIVLWDRKMKGVD